jgi:hypothetical protein
VAEDLNNKPNYCRAVYAPMAADRQIVQDVVAGTRCLRQKGATYLPLEPGEDTQHWEYRRSRAILFNATDITLNGLVGMVFRNDPKLADNVPETIRGRKAAAGQPAIEGQWANIDNAGTNGDVFCKEVFADAMRDGHAAILVDMPPKLPEGSTQADELTANRRPYWVSYTADQIINWRTSVVNGQTRLDLIVFKWTTQEPNGEYGEQPVIRYRVLRPGTWEVYRETEISTNEIQITLESFGETSLKEIPVAIVYSRKCGILESRPPLLDLALTNVAHFQKYNDFSIYLHISSRPLLWFRGRDTNKKVETVGPYTFFDVGDNGTVEFAETTGAALAAASQDIKDIETRMSIMGLSLLVKQTGGPITATEERNDQIEESSDLATAARSMKGAIELALEFHAQYLDPKATTGGNVELGASLDDLTLTPEEMKFWTNAVAAGQYSLETMWDVFGKAGKNPADFDAKREKERIEKEAQAKADILARSLDNPPRPDDDD